MKRVLLLLLVLLTASAAPAEAVNGKRKFPPHGVGSGLARPLLQVCGGSCSFSSKGWTAPLRGVGLKNQRARDWTGLEAGFCARQAEVKVSAVIGELGRSKK
jgi:hypothetical protein